MTTLKQLEKIMSEREERWCDYPEKVITEEFNTGTDYEVEKFLNNYVGKRLDQQMWLFDLAYKVLTERGNYSRKNAFGEMHCDSYMWIEKCEHSQVIVYEIQSARFLFIKENKYDETYGGTEPPMFGHFHIREIYFKHAYPAYKRTELKDVTLKHWRKQDFKVPYGDARETGYLGTSSHDILRNYETSVTDATMHMVRVIDMMNFWEVYLDNPEELE